MSSMPSVIINLKWRLKHKELSQRKMTLSDNDISSIILEKMATPGFNSCILCWIKILAGWMSPESGGE